MNERVALYLPRATISAKALVPAIRALTSHGGRVVTIVSERKRSKQCTPGGLRRLLQRMIAGEFEVVVILGGRRPGLGLVPGPAMLDGACT